MLEMYNLRQEHHSLRQELSHLLYQNDAAFRVIARLKEERDNARAQLAHAHTPSQPTSNGNAADAGPSAPAEHPDSAGSKRPAESAGAEDSQPQQKKQRSAMPDAMRKSIDDTVKTLTSQRKNSTISDTLLTAEEAQRYGLSSTYPIHKVNSGGMLGLQLCPSNDSLLLTCGGDGFVTLFDASESDIRTSVNAHGKKALSVRFVDSAGSTAISGGGDKTVRVWRLSDGDDTPSLTKHLELSEHTGAVVSVAVHPNESLAASASGDGSLAFFDLSNGTCMQTVSSPLEEKSPYMCSSMHVDGGLFGAGNARGDFELWDVREMKCVTRLPGHGASGVRSISFSENAVTASACGDEGVLVWDLRKCVGREDNTGNQKHTLGFFQNSKGVSGVSCIHFDHSSHYLAAAGSSLSVLMAKQSYTSAIDLPPLGSRKSAKSLAFGRDAKRLFVGASDHNLREFAIQETMDE